MEQSPSPPPFETHDALIVREAQPFNAEPSAGLLRQFFVTPVELFYVRSHGSVPEIDPAQYRLRVRGLVQRELNFSLDELRRQFAPVEIMATLQCAGNRREDLMALKEITDETAWGAQAIGNAVWRGVALRDVLQAAGIASGARHVSFDGLDEVEKKGRKFGFGGSIPLAKAAGAEIVLAYEMNGQPLTPAHGFPLRAVVPGYIGARSVKWLAEIALQAEPSDNYFQTSAYKLFPPQASAETVDWDEGLMLGETSINSAIASPCDGAAVAAGKTTVQGYATAGGHRVVERVDVSADGGRTWTTAKLAEEGNVWSWRFWEAELQLAPGAHTIVARAWDSAANTQPEDARAIWNFKGYMNNAWHRVRFHVK